MDADKALDLIRSNDRVVIGHACGEPSYLVDTLVKKAAQYENVEIIHMVPMGKALYVQPGMERHFHHNALFAGGPTRNAIAEGRAGYTPCFFTGYLPSLQTERSRWTRHWYRRHLRMKTAA